MDIRKSHLHTHKYQEWENASLVYACIVVNTSRWGHTHTAMQQRNACAV